MKLSISTVLKRKKDACGINLFDRNLRDGLLKMDIKTETFDIESIAYNDSEIYLFHFTPALYVSYTKLIDAFFSKTTAFKIVIIHSVYPNCDFEYCADTFSPDLSQQLNIILNYSDLIITLSDSATSTLKSWMPNISPDLIYTLYHPGLHNKYLISDLKSNEPYVFLGGITRAKKNFYSSEYLQLIESLGYVGIHVWLHSTPNISYDKSVLSVWKFTTNELDLYEWTAAIFNANWVLCPYNTKIQTVSGIISESISVGTRVLATRFPYSIEMSNIYKDYIVINNDFKKWPEIILSNNKKLPPVNYPNWDNFIKDLMNILRSSPK